MKVIIDERETALYDKCNIIVNYEGNNTYVRLSKKVLPLGDILIHTDDDKPFCVIERKSLSDLLSSIKDGRYEEQSHRLLNASGLVPHNVIYIIEGMTSQLKSLGEKRMVYSAITSLNFFKGFSVFRTNSLQETAEMIVWISDKIDRNFLKNIFPFYLNRPAILYQSIKVNTIAPSDPIVENEPENTMIVTPPLPPSTTTLNPEEIQSQIQNQNQDQELQLPLQSQENQSYSQFVKKVKKDNITPENIGEILLCQIPGISSVTAVAIMKKFPSFPKLLIEMEKNPDCLKDTTYESNGKTRKISKACIESIQKYLVDKPAIIVT